MQLRVTLNLVHYQEPAISWKQTLIVLFPFISRQWTLSWCDHCQLQMPGSNLLLVGHFPLWNIPDVLSVQLTEIKKQLIDFDQVIMSGTFWYSHIFMHEWPKEKYPFFFSCNLVISLSAEKEDNKYWQYIRLGSAKSYPCYLEQQQLLIFRHNQVIYIHDYGSNHPDTCSFHIRHLLASCFLCSAAIKIRMRGFGVF